MDEGAKETDAKVVETSADDADKVDNGRASPTESEYDSADGNSYSDKPRRSHKGSGSETDGSVGLERESGDGQESAPSKKVDDDEDKKNPQYIPKRGTFYEHDDRTADDVEAEAVQEAEKGEKEPKKKVWQDKKERWSHDRFNDSEQAPKSRSELVAIYGYDIRNEDGPPRARRRRRYGRGPNKYTRNWEDEDAYNKPPTPRIKKPPKKPLRGEEFPPLSGSETNTDNIKPEKIKSEREINEGVERQWESNGNMNNPSSSTFTNDNNRIKSQDYSNKNRIGTGRVAKPKKEIKDSDYRGFTTQTRQSRNLRTDEKVVPRPQRSGDDFVQTQNFTNKNNNMQELEKDMGKLNMDTYKGSNKYNNSGRQGSVPPRLQSDQKGSKRYSSIRQRSLPETATQSFNQHSNYYPNEFNQQGHMSHPSTTQIPSLATMPPPVPVTATPILPAPQFAAPFPQAPPPFLQAGVAPAPFIPQPTPPILNYVAGQPQFSQGFQGYQQQFNPVSQPDGMYQPQTGITYYSTDQQISQRAVPRKRPKAAIPIVAPPSEDFKGRTKGEDEPDITENIIENSNLNQESIKH